MTNKVGFLKNDIIRALKLLKTFFQKIHFLKGTPFVLKIFDQYSKSRIPKDR